MPELRIKGQKHRYSVSDDKCIGRSCLGLGFYQVRGATGGGGSRNTGESSPCCMNRAYHGCPSDKDALYSTELAKQRKAEGYKNA